MINPFAFMWKQLNGPQITAICESLFSYFKSTYDDVLDYFNDLSIETAKTDHLTWIGILQGVARPLIPVPDEDMFWFTETYDYVDGAGAEIDPPGHKIPDAGFPSEHGLASLSNRGRGGKFSDLETGGGYSYIPDYVYRALLRGNASSSGVLGSLVALDDMLYAIYEAQHPTDEPTYKFTWTRSDTHSTYTQGDLIVDLGVTSKWAMPYETQAQIKLLGQTAYYPIPKVIPAIREG